nr:type II secretion system F family protein [Aliamphritea spongicola]
MYLLSAGISLDRSLEVLLHGQHNDGLHDLVQDILKSIREGQTFSAALDKHRLVFSPVYISLIRGAEATGNIAAGMTTLNDYLRRSRQLREQLSQAMVYPVVLLTVALLSVLMILVFVVPQFADIIEGTADNLPPETQLVFWLSEVTTEYGVFVLVALTVLVIVCRYLFLAGRLNALLDYCKTAVPWWREIFIQSELSRFCRCSGALLCNGVPLPEALSIGCRSLTMNELSVSVTRALSQVKEGGALSEHLARVNYVPPLLLQLVQIGEETGETGSMLLRVADIYDRQLAIRTKKLLSLIEPAMIVLLGVIIAVLILSLLSAIVGINDIAL